MSALSKIDALTAIANGKLVGFVADGTENVIDKSWSIEQILSCENDLYLKIDEITLNGFVFLKPFSLDELVDGQEVFLIGNTGRIVQGKFTPEYDELVFAVKNGYVQRDKANAEIQALAFQNVLGIASELEFIEIDFTTLMNASVKPKRNSKKKENAEIVVEEIPKNQPPVISIESELQLYLDGLRSCNNAEEVESTLYEVDKVGFNAEQMLEITMLKEKKLAEFEPEQKLSFEDLAEKEYQRVLNELLEAAKKASTPKEANALYKYSSHWTEEQRKPLIDAVHQRLAELNPPEKSQSSLMVRIQESTNLIELAKLEEDILKADPAIQERLTSYANQRRTYLVDSVELPWETT